MPYGLQQLPHGILQVKMQRHDFTIVHNSLLGTKCFQTCESMVQGKAWRAFFPHLQERDFSAPFLCIYRAEIILAVCFCFFYFSLEEEQQ